jgi:HEAT repeat protein/putative zinc finger protein
MKCEWVQTNGALYLYDELPDDARHEVEQHLAKCPDCTAEFDSLRQFQSAITVLKGEEPSPSLLAASRMQLQEALESAEQSRGWNRWTMDVAGWMHQIRFSPALAVILIMIGFGSGIMTTVKTSGNKNPGNAGSSTQTDATDTASIASIRGITQNPQTNNVEIKYDRVVPDTAQGSLDNPKIQQLLLYAARNNYNSGVRLDSIDMLTQKPEDAQVREALIFALRYDKNPGVRLKALAGLRPYVKSDMRVRDVMLEALLRDSNSGVRTEAIRSLQAVTADSSVRATLMTLAEKDNNKFIRNESRRVLASLPEIE